jgi:hypothetical protein
MSNIQKRVDEFFASHPTTKEVYEALGKLFTDKSKAEQFLAGVAGRFVTTHTPGNIEFEKVSDEIRHQVINQEHKVNNAQIAYESAPGVDKEKRMNDWLKEKENLEKLTRKFEKQLGMEEKDELLEKENKPHSGKTLTAADVKAKIGAQEVMIKSYEQIVANKALKGPKKKDAKVQLEIAKKDLKTLKAELKRIEEGGAPLTATVVDQATQGVKMVDHTVTQDDLDANPDMEEAGVKVGDTIQIQEQLEAKGGKSAETE